MHFDDTQTDKRSHRVDEDDQGQRLDNYLARRLAEFPKSYIFKIIRSGEVRVNGARVAPDCRLQANDLLRLPPKAEHFLAGTYRPAGAPDVGKHDGPAAVSGRQGPLRAGMPDSPAALPVASSLLQGQALEMSRRLSVIYEDEALVVLNKPFGLAVHGGSGVNLGVIESLRLARPQAKFLELAHRLDRETSGLLIVAKKRLALVNLQEQFRSRSTSKTYQALVFGRVPLREKTIRLALSRDPETPTGDRRVRPDPAGLEAVSIVRGLAHGVLANGLLANGLLANGLLAKGAQSGETVVSRVQVRIETGRTHQIRVHLSASGFPILGDPKYGDFPKNRELQRAGIKRMFLHAWLLSFRHPVTSAMVQLEAPLPSGFVDLVPDVPALTGASHAQK